MAREHRRYLRARKLLETALRNFKEKHKSLSAGDKKPGNSPDHILAHFVLANSRLLAEALERADKHQRIEESEMDYRA